jgi:hypothetical protein
MLYFMLDMSVCVIEVLSHRCIARDELTRDRFVAAMQTARFGYFERHRRRGRVADGPYTNS